MPTRASRSLLEYRKPRQPIVGRIARLSSSLLSTVALLCLGGCNLDFSAKTLSEPEVVNADLSTANDLATDVAGMDDADEVCVGAECDDVQTSSCLDDGSCEAECSDGEHNHDETDIDCGGPACDGCPDGRTCEVHQDCLSQLCQLGVCVGVASCGDGIQNQDETDVDCGGATCAPCATGRQCIRQTDCEGACIDDQCTDYTSCLQIQSLSPLAESGVFSVDIDADGPMTPMPVYCDLETDGGGWMLVLNYVHKGGTDPDLNILADRLPLMNPLASLGDDGSSDVSSFGHASNALLASLPFAETRWWATTSSHERTIHFTTTSSLVNTYLRTGVGCMYDELEGGGVFDPSETVDLNAPWDTTLPLNTAGEKKGHCDTGDRAMTTFPFFASSAIGKGAAHWSLAAFPTMEGGSRRWAVDDIPDGFSTDTWHQVWVRPDPCADGVQSANESAADCGGTCSRCALGRRCNTGSDCETGVCDGGVCGAPVTSCRAMKAASPETESGVYTLMGEDGEAFEAYCEHTAESGGWTLAWVTARDGVDTWSWNKRKRMSTDETVVGDVHHLNADFKSKVVHDLVFEDLLFIHHPSGIRAEYEAVSDGTMALGEFIDETPVPNCSLDGEGYSMTGGTLIEEGTLCDTRLYFNPGDHDSERYCELLGYPGNNVAFGPAWSRENNQGCPLDDPGGSGLGPSYPCDGTNCGASGVEAGGLGFGSALGLNDGDQGTGHYNMWVLIR